MKKQANARNCFVCGVNNIYGLHLNFYEPTPGETQAEIVVGDQFQGYPGVVHGGIVAAMLDEVSGRVFMGEGEPRFMVTARLSVRYRKPVLVGQRLVLKGHAREDKGRIAIAVGEIFDRDGNLLAESETVLAEIPAEIAANFDSTGKDWKVYPDEENYDDR